MSVCFRPVVESWGSASNMFLERDTMIIFLRILADQAGTVNLETEYGVFTVVWFEDGAKILDYIEKDPRFNSDNFVEQFSNQGIEINRERQSLESLMSNMRCLSSGWRKSVDSGDRSLRFYLD